MAEATVPDNGANDEDCGRVTSVTGDLRLRYTPETRDRENPIPRVTINTGIVGPDGQEEQLAEYICDHPGRPGDPAMPD